MTKENNFEVYPETPKQKKERLKLEILEKEGNIKKLFQPFAWENDNKGNLIKKPLKSDEKTQNLREGLDELSDYLIQEFQLEEESVSPQKLEAKIENILQEYATTYNIREALSKVKRKIWFLKRAKEHNPETIEDLLKADIEPEHFIVNGLIPEKAISCLGGAPASAKSWMLLSLADAIAHGKPLFGQFPTIKKRVLILDLEAPLYESQRRIKKLGLEPTKNLSIECLPFWKIDNPNTLENLLDFIKDRFDVVAIDAVRDCHSQDENSSQAMQQVMDSIKKITGAGKSVILLHHLRKEQLFSSKNMTQQLRGSNVFEATLSSFIGIKASELGNGNLELTFEHSKLRQGRPQRPFKIRLLEEWDKMRFEWIGFVEDELSKKEATKQAVIVLLEKEGELYQQQILQKLIPLNFADRTIRQVISEMKQNNELNQTLGGGKRIFLSLKK